MGKRIIIWEVQYCGYCPYHDDTGNYCEKYNKFFNDDDIKKRFPVWCKVGIIENKNTKCDNLYDICKYYDNKLCNIKHSTYCNKDYCKCKKYKDIAWFLRCGKIVMKKYKKVFKELAK